MSNWTLFSNHGHVLVCLARDPNARLRDVAADVGITERAVQKIVRDLQQGEMVNVSKQGRRNRYSIHNKKHLRHDLEAHCTIADLMDLVVEGATQDESVAKPRSIDPRPVHFPFKELKSEIAKKPKAEESKTEEPKAEESKTKEPKAEEPKTEVSKAEESKVQQSEPVQSKQTKPAPARNRRSQSKTEEPEASDSSERQQRSLF